MTDAIASTPQPHIACSSVSLSHAPIIGRCRPSTNIPASWLPRFAVRDSFQTSVCDCTRKAPIFRAHCRQALGRSNGLANVPWHRATGIPLSVACYIVSCQLNRNASSRRLPSQRMKMPLHLDRNWFITCAAELYLAIGPPMPSTVRHIGTAGMRLNVSKPLPSTEKRTSLNKQIYSPALTLGTVTAFMLCSLSYTLPRFGANPCSHSLTLTTVCSIVRLCLFPTYAFVSCQIHIQQGDCSWAPRPETCSVSLSRGSVGHDGTHEPRNPISTFCSGISCSCWLPEVLSMAGSYL
jgi:hypothetical protein